jgi:hypothetical protein
MADGEESLMHGTSTVEFVRYLGVIVEWPLLCSISIEEYCSAVFWSVFTAVSSTDVFWDFVRYDIPEDNFQQHILFSVELRVVHSIAKLCP